MIVEVLIFLVLTLLIYVKLNQKPKGLPPGEWGLPLLGYIPEEGEKATQLISKFRAKYGNIFMVKLGSRVSIFLCDYKTVKNTFSKLSASSRPDMFSINFFNKSLNSGLIMSTGHVWNSNRRFALKVLRDFGLGKSSLEDTINKETENFIENLKAKVNKPTKIEWNLNVAVVNVIWGLVADTRFDIEDEEIRKFSQLLSVVLTLREGPMRFLDFYPWLIPLLPYQIKDSWMKVGDIERDRELLRDFFMKIINKCEKTLNKNDPRHYIDMYLIEREQQKDNPAFDFRSRDYDDLYATLSDIFIAGSDTTSATIKWMLLYMAKYPEIQKKIQREIDSVVPRNKFPQLLDRPRLPYLEAVIHDLQRVVSFVPASVAHETTEDIIIDGYNSPKGTVLYACSDSIHHDKKYWKRPYELYPEHFLDENGNFEMQKEGYLPFSLGKRQCLGESMAKMELYLFISSILQNFEISEPENNPISLEPHPIINIFNYPRDEDFVFRLRT